MPPHTTKRRATKNDENCQKIKLYGSLTTKELKKKHSSRPVGGEETSSQGREDIWQGGSWRTGVGEVVARSGEAVVPLYMQINWEEQLGNKTYVTTQGSGVGR